MLGVLVQVKFQGNDVFLFEKHSTIVSTFVVIGNVVVEAWLRYFFIFDKITQIHYYFNKITIFFSIFEANNIYLQKIIYHHRNYLNFGLYDKINW